MDVVIVVVLVLVILLSALHLLEPLALAFEFRFLPLDLERDPLLLKPLLPVGQHGIGRQRVDVRHIDGGSLKSGEPEVGERLPVHVRLLAVQVEDGEPVLVLLAALLVAELRDVIDLIERHLVTEVRPEPVHAGTATTDRRQPLGGPALDEVRHHRAKLFRDDGVRHRDGIGGFPATTHLLASLLPVTFGL